MASAIDLLAILAWHNTEDGQNGRNRPKPVPRPADIAAESPTIAPLMGGEVASVMTVGEFLRRRDERAERWRQRHQKED